MLFQSSKGRPALSVESKRRSKLPPRLAKQREQKEKEKHQRGQSQPADQVAASNTNNMMPKIENWNNEMANNVMSPAKGTASTEQNISQQDSAANRSKGCAAAGTQYCLAN